MNREVKKELSEIMEMYKWETFNNVDWDEICFAASYYFIELSKEFILEFKDKLNNDTYIVLSNEKIRNRKELEKFKAKFS